MSPSPFYATIVLCTHDDERDRETVENFELLVRSILLREDQPAIIVLGHFSPQVHQENGFGGPETWHTLVAQFYDVPHIRCVSLSPLGGVSSSDTTRVA